MKIKLPKATSGVYFERLFAVEMNSFDVEALLGSLFYLVITRGRQRAGRMNDAKAFDSYLDALAKHPRMQGFDDAAGRRLLSKWVRSSVASMGGSGRGGQGGEQIEFVLPLTLLTYKTGLPAEGSRQRNVHLFLYRTLRDTLAWANALPNADAALTAVVVKAFGKGVEVGSAPAYDGRFDGESEVDLHTLLCLNYLDGFKPTPASGREAVDVQAGDALPGTARALGRDLLRYLAAYHERVPPLALTRGLIALVGFEMLVYTIKLMYATNTLVATGEMPPAMTDSTAGSPPSLYVDFTRERGGLSDEMARACVERDLEEVRAHCETVLVLRTIHRFVEARPQLRDKLSPLATPKYLQALAKLRREEGAIESRAEIELDTVKAEMIGAAQTEGDREEIATLFMELERRHPESAFDRLVRLLMIAQEKKAVQKFVQWFWAIGGLGKPFGMLDGSLRGRRSWRYAMSDDLLAALVHLAFVAEPAAGFENPTIQPRLRLSEFLGWLEQRFGVIVDRPPTFLDSAAHRAAAKGNLDALRRRLRQMGLFEELSDDFTAQYLKSPFAPEAA